MADDQSAFEKLKGKLRGWFGEPEARQEDAMRGPIKPSLPVGEQPIAPPDRPLPGGVINPPTEGLIPRPQPPIQQSAPPPIGSLFPPDFDPQPPKPPRTSDVDVTPVLGDTPLVGPAFPNYLFPPATLCCVGYNHETNDLVAIISVTQETGFGGNVCSMGTLLYVGFFLENGSFPLNPAAGNRNVLFIGNSSVRVYDIPRSPVTPIRYEVTLALDSSDENTLRLILGAIQRCFLAAGKRSPTTLSCTLRAGSPVEYTDYQGRGPKPILSWLESEIQLPKIGTLGSSKQIKISEFGNTWLEKKQEKWIRSGTLAVHAALLKNGKIFFYSGTEVMSGKFYVARTQGGKLVQFYTYYEQNEGGPRVENFKNVYYEIATGRIFDPISNTIAETPLPEYPFPYVDQFELKININADNPNAPIMGYDDVFKPDSRKIGLNTVPIIRRYPSLFCSGHCFLSDGRLFVAGGMSRPTGGLHQHQDHKDGLNMAVIFDPDTNTWLQVQPGMKHGRWYPTCILRGDGSVFIIGGHTDEIDQTIPPYYRKFTSEELKQVNTLPLRHENTDLEIYLPDTNSWIFESDRNASYASDPYGSYFEKYPHLILLPSGKIFSATTTGSIWNGQDSSRIYEDGTRVWDPSTRMWSNPPLNTTSLTEYTADLLPLMPEYKYLATILATGDSKDTPKLGETDGKGIAWFIQPESTFQGWRKQILPLYGQRLNGIAVILADGSIALIGGISGVNSDGEAVDTLAKNEVEIYDPFSKGSYDPLAENQWSIGASLQFARNYHSVALLIPDGRVWISGSNINNVVAASTARQEMEYFSPDYLTRGPRPQYTLSINHVSYEQEFIIYLRNGWKLSEIQPERIGIIKCSSSTHGFCVDQRYIGLVVITTDPNAVRVTVMAPPNGNIATPGYYMLFILSRTGAPSVAEIIHVG